MSKRIESIKIDSMFGSFRPMGFESDGSVLDHQDGIDPETPINFGVVGWYIAGVRRLDVMLIHGSSDATHHFLVIHELGFRLPISKKYKLMTVSDLKAAIEPNCIPHTNFTGQSNLQDSRSVKACG